MSSEANQSLGPPKRLGRMARREMYLAYALLTPTFLVVIAVVLGPLLANFWLSAKPVTLENLRPPRLIVNEQFRGSPELPNDPVKVEYRIRNSSQSQTLGATSFTDTLPAGLDLAVTDARCELSGRELSCTLGDLEPKKRDRLTFEGTVTEEFLAAGLSPKDSEPLLSYEAPNALTSLDFTWDNFAQMFSAEEFWHVLRVSFYYTVFGTVGALLLGLIAALLLNTAFPLRSVARGLFLFPYVAPVIAVAFTWIVLLDPFSGTLNSILQQMGATDEPINFFGKRAAEFTFLGLTFEFPVALTTVIAFEVWRYFPLSFLFILARMQSISSEMYEAAEIDGATPLQQFWHISLPQLVGILAVLFLLRFIWTFNKFDDIFLLTGGAAGTRTLTVNVYEQAFAISNLGAGAAVAVMVFAVLLTFSLLFFHFAPKDEG